MFDEPTQKAGTTWEIKIFMQNLEEKREKIEKIDKKIIQLLGERLDLVKEIGRIKKEENLEIEDKDREGKIKVEYKKIAKDLNLDLEELWQVFNKILEWSKKVQGEK